MTQRQQYSQRIQQFAQQTEQLKKKSLALSVLRAACFSLLPLGIYQFYHHTNNLFWMALSAAGMVSFLVLIHVHQALTARLTLAETLYQINHDELQFLENHTTPPLTGKHVAPSLHDFAFDLDVFGEKSLFQFLNRAQTYIGQSHLAQALCHTRPVNEIQDRQDAVKECKEKLDWRQQIQASAFIAHDQQRDFQQLLHWSTTPIEKIPNWLRVYAYLGPVLFFVTLGAWMFLPGDDNWKLCSAVFTINLILFSLVLKIIKQQIPAAEKIHQQILHYSLLLQHIEGERFQNVFMKSLQLQLQTPKGSASQQLKQLSNIFERMDSLHNLVGATLFNGAGLYHAHVLQTLIQWKQQYATSLQQWLDVIGETETIHSLANLAFNHPEFCFPTLSAQQEFEVTDLGHPLIPPQQRVCNSVSLQTHPFIILTGSNMSGKSTFLRTLGINMILASTGAPVCAQSARIHPLPMKVSMRLSDSLGDNESFFFAEVKKLKSIIDALKKGPCFVLLDEILRGTNSDDKRNGTILFLEQLIRHHTIGIIATHDLEVCRTTDNWPNYLRNCCFEVEIENNELVFDYKLRDGICQNKSASFLMKKMEII